VERTAGRGEEGASFEQIQGLQFRFLNANNVRRVYGEGRFNINTFISVAQATNVPRSKIKDAIH
jgi:hypothetical protein